jgi:hypothetical protein
MPKRPRNVTMFFGRTILFSIFPWGSAQVASVFINEIHYDNAGLDMGRPLKSPGRQGLIYSGGLSSCITDRPLN